MLWPRGTYQRGPRSQVSRLVAFRLLPFQKFVIFGATCLRAWKKEPTLPACTCVCLVAQSGLSLCNPTDCTPARLFCPQDSPGKNTGVGCHFLLLENSEGRIKNAGLIARDWVLALVLLLPGMWTSKPRDQTWVSCIASGFFAGWATREVPPGLSYYLFECVRKLF